MEVARGRSALLTLVGSGLVHELRNPLAYVTANHQLLELDLRWLLDRSTDEETRARLVELQELTADCRAGMAKLTMLLESLSKVTSPRAGREAADLGEIVEGALKILRPRLNRLEVRVTIGDEIPAVTLPPAMLGQAVLALLAAAAERTAPGCELHVSVRAAGGAAELRIGAGGGDDGGVGGEEDLGVARALASEAGGSVEVDRGAASCDLVLRLPAAAP